MNYELAGFMIFILLLGGVLGYIFGIEIFGGRLLKIGDTLSKEGNITYRGRIFQIKEIGEESPPPPSFPLDIFPPI